MAELHRVSFRAARLAEVQEIDCGDTPCGVDASNWIKGPLDSPRSTALKDMQQFNTEVWLYKTETNELVGFASLGGTWWNIGSRKDKKKYINIIPWIGLDTKFWQKPKGAEPNDRYSMLILDDIISETDSHKDREPFIGLLVHRANIPAIKLYNRADFVPHQSPYTDKETNRVYGRMLLDLRPKSHENQAAM